MCSGGNGPGESTFEALKSLATHENRKATATTSPPSSHLYHLLAVIWRDSQTVTSSDTQHRRTMKHLQPAPAAVPTTHTSSGFPSTQTGQNSADRRGEAFATAVQKGGLASHGLLRVRAGSGSRKGPLRTASTATAAQLRHRNIPLPPGKARGDSRRLLLSSGSHPAAFESSHNTVC